MKQVSTALQKAVSMLARREHSVYELRQKLASREYDDVEIEQALEKLVEKGLQSDERFTEAFVQSHIERGQGPLKIRAALRQRGIDDSQAEQCINDPNIDWFERARACYRKKYGADEVSDYKDKSRRLRFMQQRGFEAAHSRYAMEIEDDE